jgi:hypothetical protein
LQGVVADDKMALGACLFWFTWITGLGGFPWMVHIVDPWLAHTAHICTCSAEIKSDSALWRSLWSVFLSTLSASQLLTRPDGQLVPFEPLTLLALCAYYFKYNIMWGGYFVVLPVWSSKSFVDNNFFLNILLFLLFYYYLIECIFYSVSLHHFFF